MNLETGDVSPQGDTVAAPPVEAPAIPVHPAALFAPRPTAVPVIVKKRRLAMPNPAPEAITTTPDDAGRRPRVFVVPRDEAATPDASTEPAAGAPNSPPAPRRRRRTALQRPSPVVHIVPPTPESAAPDTAAEADSPGLPPLPAVDEYRAVLASLQGLRAIVDDVRRAQGFTLRPRRRPVR